VKVRLRSGQAVEITTVAERPALASKGFDAGPWGVFMQYNRVADAHYFMSVKEFPELCLVATAEDGSVVANAHAVRFAFRGSFPAGGYEQLLVWAYLDHDRGNATDTAGALNISVAASLQGQGLSGLMLGALRSAVVDAGLRRLVAPVRPTWKDREPRTPMSSYAARLRSDGLPYDPWLRTHVRAGGRIVGVAPTSWLIAGTMAEWHTWTGLPFDRDGYVDVPHALAPVYCSVASDHAVYVEPGVWVDHELPSS
jgi:hypothetical protein